MLLIGIIGENIKELNKRMDKKNYLWLLFLLLVITVYDLYTTPEEKLILAGLQIILVIILGFAWQIEVIGYYDKKQSEQDQKTKNELNKDE